MPFHKSSKFCARIYYTSDGKKEEVAAEFDVSERSSPSGKPVVSCYIAAQTGQYFKCRFSYGAKRGGLPFSGAFSRDGEFIANSVVQRPNDMDGEIYGWEADDGEIFHMQFHELSATGNPNVKRNRKVPRKVGVLELIIRHHNPLNDPEEVQQFDVTVRPVYRDASQSTQRRATTKAPPGPCPHTVNDWYDPKPRQTHLAEMVSASGEVWRPPYWNLENLGKPEADIRDDPSVVVIFKFYYSSLGIHFLPPRTLLTEPIPVDYIQKASQLSTASERRQVEMQRKLLQELELRQSQEREALKDRIKAELGYVMGDKSHPIDLDDSD
ncbi:hypothetical protein BXZ70DRAFT_1009031 [Cristinia sonorae]|uniref:Uncharacterized protein n=1 Tax=Cristinia sonorae TaxID=1940300 RepID=A0A8K0UN27_9AGAR|nr:hypothetical protein BXZ70DRAFT_1009031 [Cristinia sonorae]